MTSCSRTAATPSCRPGSAGTSAASRVPTSFPSPTSSAKSGEDEKARQSARPRSLRSRRMRPSALKTRLSGSRNEPGSRAALVMSASVNLAERSAGGGALVLRLLDVEEPAQALPVHLRHHARRGHTARDRLEQEAPAAGVDVGKCRIGHELASKWKLDRSGAWRPAQAARYIAWDTGERCSPAV